MEYVWCSSPVSTHSCLVRRRAPSGLSEHVIFIFQCRTAVPQRAWNLEYFGVGEFVGPYRFHVVCINEASQSLRRRLYLLSLLWRRHIRSRVRHVHGLSWKLTSFVVARELLHFASLSHWTSFIYAGAAWLMTLSSRVYMSHCW